MHKFKLFSLDAKQIKILEDPVSDFLKPLTTIKFDFESKDCDLELEKIHLVSKIVYQLYRPFKFYNEAHEDLDDEKKAYGYENYSKMLEKLDKYFKYLQNHKLFNFDNELNHKEQKFVQNFISKSIDPFLFVKPDLNSENYDKELTKLILLKDLINDLKEQYFMYNIKAEKIDCKPISNVLKQQYETRITLEKYFNYIVFKLNLRPSCHYGYIKDGKHAELEMTLKNSEV